MALLGLNLGQRCVVLTVFLVFGALSLLLIIFHVGAEARFDNLKVGGAPFPGTFTIIPTRDPRTVCPVHRLMVNVERSKANPMIIWSILSKSRTFTFRLIMKSDVQKIFAFSVPRL